MKTLLSLLGALVLLSGLTACDGNILTSKENSTIGDQFDNDEVVELGFTTELENITSENASAYPVSGVCDPSSGDVSVVFGAPVVSQSFPCDLNGKFSGEMDVRVVTSNPPSISGRQGEQTASVSLPPINDQEGPLNAPVATGPGSYVGLGLSYSLPISCNEAGEVVSISGVGIDPSPQTYTCSGAGSESFPLTLAGSIETADPNNLTVSSTDGLGNPSGSTTMVNVPVDTQGPTVLVSNGGGIVQGQTASFTVTVTDANVTTFNYSVNTSGAETATYTCIINPCLVTTSVIANAGTLTLTVAADVVNDDVGNTGDSASRTSSLTVNAAGAIGFANPLPTISTINASAYPVSGSCDDALGSVTVNVMAPAASQVFPCNAPGQFSGNLNLSTVTSNPANISVTQGVNTSNASPNPVNDQTPIANAPTLAAQSPASGTSANLSVNCTEAGEVLSFSGSGLSPSPQTHTCASPLSNPETVNLTFANPIETADPNTITLSSTDVNGNPTTNDSTFNLPIDNVAPAVGVVAGSGVVEGNNASFTVTVTDGSSFTSFTPTVSSGTVSSGACTASPCTVTVAGASAGALTMTVAIGAVVDAAGNSNTVASSDSLSVGASTLSVTSAPTGTSLNAAAYPVSGDCDAGEGDVTVTVGTPDVSATVSCTGSPGSYTASLNISGVTANPMSVVARQNGNSASFAPDPVNDQTGPASAPSATGPGSVIGGTNYNLPINCNEAGEVVSITGDGIDPDPQTYTCTASGSENFPLTLEQGVEFSSPNNLTLSSTDVLGNPAGGATTVDVPVDTQGPRIAITNGGNIIQGQTASFTVTVTDQNFSTINYNVNTSGAEAASYNCVLNPCTINTGVVSSTGALTLTATANLISDDIGNTGDTIVRSSGITVAAPDPLNFDEPLPPINAANVSSYPVSGVCDDELGSVVVNATSPPVSQSFSCSSPGQFSGTMNLAAVTSSTVSFTVSQGVNSANAATSPIKDVNLPVLTITEESTGPYTAASTVDFRVTVADSNLPPSYSFAVQLSSGTSSPAVCTSNPCDISVTGQSIGAFTISVLAGQVQDQAENSNILTNGPSITINNAAPTISTIAVQTTNEDQPLVDLPFTIDDADGPLNCSTSVIAGSSNTPLIGVGDIVFSGSYPNCLVTLTPKANAHGSANITFTVSDGSLSSQEIFAFNVNHIPDPFDIDGTVLSGQTLTFTPNPVDDLTGATYQWFANSVAIPGATSSTYVVTLADEESLITLQIDGVESDNSLVTNYLVMAHEFTGVTIAGVNFTGVAPSFTNLANATDLGGGSVNFQTGPNSTWSQKASSAVAFTDVGDYLELTSPDIPRASTIRCCLSSDQTVDGYVSSNCSFMLNLSESAGRVQTFSFDAFGSQVIGNTPLVTGAVFRITRTVTGIEVTEDGNLIYIYDY